MAGARLDIVQVVALPLELAPFAGAIPEEIDGMPILSNGGPSFAPCASMPPQAWTRWQFR